MNRYISLARRIYETRYNTAEFLIAAGSLIRGEGTKTSDLDIVVIYDRLDAAYRESFTFEDIMVEVFAHDLSTVKYFMYTMDYNDASPVMATMISEGIVVPRETELSRQLKQLAAEHIFAGPEAATKSKIDSMRYSITNLLDDLKDSRNRFEQIATGCRLYEEVAQLYFASNRFWKGSAKSIVRVMNQYDQKFSERFHSSFDLLFREGDDSKVIAVTEAVLHVVGGYLFDGYKLEARPDWRRDQ